MKDLNFFKCRDSFCLKEISGKNNLAQLGECDGILIRSSEKVARSIIASLRDKKFSGKIGIYGGDDAFNRRALESLKIDYLVSPEKFAKSDNVKQRDSGLNHVVAKMAAQKGIRIIVDIGEISKLNGKNKARRIARIMQNVKICRKVGCGILIGSFGRKKSDVVNELGRKSFGESLGMSSGEVRDCILF